MLILHFAKKLNFYFVPWQETLLLTICIIRLYKILPFDLLVRVFLANDKSTIPNVFYDFSHIADGVSTLFIQM